MSLLVGQDLNFSTSQMNETHLRDPRSSVFSTAHWLEFIVCRAIDTHYMMRPVLPNIFYTSHFHALIVFDFMQRIDR